MKTSASEFNTALQVKLRWKRDPDGYELVSQARRPVLDLLDDGSDLPELVIKGRSSKAKEYKTTIPHTELVLDFLNARGEKGLRRFVNKWGLPREGTALAVSEFERERLALWQCLLIGERFQKDKSDHYRKALLGVFGRNMKMPVNLAIEPNGRFVPYLACDPRDPVRFARLYLWYSATGKPLITSCELGCGKAVKINGGGRPNRFCPGGACQKRAKRKEALSKPKKPRK